MSLERVDRDLPKEAVARIRSSGAPLLGVVTNTMGRRSSRDYGYGQYGYGKYGYSYDINTAYANYVTQELDSEGGAIC